MKNFRWDIFTIGIGLAFLLFYCCSCSCEYHLNKVRAKCPATVSNDTITVSDTVKIPFVEIDSTFFSKPGDTVYLTKDRLKIKYVNLGDGRHSIAGKCDTVYLNRFIKVPYTKTVYKPDWSRVIRKNIIGISLALIALILVIFGLRRLTKE